MVGMATQDVEMVEYFFAHTVAPAFVAVLVPTLSNDGTRVYRHATHLPTSISRACALSPFSHATD